MKIHSYACTHIGRRPNNEDAFLVSAELGLFAVADGMGGYEGGEVASHLAVSSMLEFYRDMSSPGAGDDTVKTGRNGQLSAIAARGQAGARRLDAAIRLANRRVCDHKRGAHERMGSTVAALDLRDGVAVIGHVGDSRVYRLRDGALEPLTRDHSLYEMLRATGTYPLPPPEEYGYRNVVTRALGIAESSPEIRVEPVAPGDVYLLCSDGLLERLDEDGLLFLLETRAPADACAAMVELAYELGGRDNITAVVVAVTA
ncbi:MAG: serine/threonine-protein phosphatase [Myxococcales bacterium]|nr:serine/threonine-protein phosphatase [Myxococcales bacterium]MCB9750774.1 serine/threonine-protein phosphatase [Myxococcales bacterium]